MKSVHRALVVVFLLIAAPLVAQTARPTPADSWTWLRAGNETWTTVKDLTFTDVPGARERTAGGQKPRVTIIACSDSRVPPELIFHKSLGELFVIRVAGNVVDEMALASVEYAVPVKQWSDLIVVLGHEECGAVKAALNPEDPGTPSLDALVARIRESFLGIPYSATPSKELWRRAAEANARNVAAYLTAHSPALRRAVTSGSVRIVPAYYELESGLVTPLAP